MPSSPLLTLTVLDDNAERFGEEASKCFDTEGGRIGRAEDCEWVLRAAGVSRVHAVVRCVNDTYFLEDRSSNGLLLNGEPLRKAHPTPLKDGDRLYVDTFEIGVAVDTGRGADTQPRMDPQATTPLAAFVGDAPLADANPSLAAELEPLIPDSRLNAVAGHGLDPLAFLDAAPDLHAFDAAPADHGWNHTAGDNDVFHPPRPADTLAAVLPDNWDLTDLPVAPVAAPPAAMPMAAPDSTPAPVPAAVTTSPTHATSTEVAPDLERLFHVAVDGIIDVLRARTELKNTFRLPVTVIQRSENNPLKFSPDAREAVGKLLSPANPAFLTGEAALGDAVDDIRYHQVAMLFGMRTAFDAMLARFAPARFEPAAGAPASRSPFRRKDEPWDVYRRQFDALTADPDDCFKRLFGDVFAQAYEEQLARLKSPRTAGLPGTSP
ncbi:type VI secretion system-associated FHA domain protein TagH [Xanthomonas sp. NCPPB 2632]|uniref:type VI secretion system-associated FHA domain protein TagH n=1 Tax=Xanthomonas sp. NCPPB 2632 TaxID=3240912 RepID=UPI00351427D6